MALRRPPQILSAAAAALLALSCGGGGASTPSATTPVPTPTPVASSSPLPDSGASAGSCPLGMGDVTAACSKTSPQLTAAVEAAIDRLVRERPALFNMKDEQGGGGQYRVLDEEAYLEGLVANLRAAGLCAQRSLDRERVVVKSSNAFSEEWDVLSSQGFIRRTSYAYQQSCQPASFPVTAEDLTAFVWVGFFSLECSPGTTAPDFGEKLLPLACDGYVTATPKQKNGRDVPSWVHGSDVQWHVRDGAELISVDPDWRFGNEFNRVLRPKGVGYFSICATVLGKMGCLNARTIP